MTIRFFDPKLGQAYQGDIVIMLLPKGIGISASATKIPMRDNMLVLAEGEVTGHHHAIRFGSQHLAMFRDDGLARDLAAGTLVQQGQVHLYRDQAALDALLRKGTLTTGDLCIGFLHVEENAPPVTHDEHDGIRLPAGDYYIGAKQEMDAGLARRVAD